MGRRKEAVLGATLRRQFKRIILVNPTGDRPLYAVTAWERGRAWSCGTGRYFFDIKKRYQRVYDPYGVFRCPPDTVVVVEA